jgi:hypothetical protein
MSAQSKIFIRAIGLAMAGIVILSPAVRAQRGFGGGRGFGVSRGDGFGRHGGRRHAGGAYFPFFFDDYDDYGPDVVQAPPQTIVVQTPQSGAQALAPPAPAEPLVIELRGDRWVRLNGYGEAQAVAETTPRQSAGTAKAEASRPPATLPPAVLVFRDGHQEEVGNYVIVGSTIYARSNYWVSGSWTRKIEMAELDLPTTLKVNQQRGAQFRLPSSPIEIMMRP